MTFAAGGSSEELADGICRRLVSGRNGLPRDSWQSMRGGRRRMRAALPPDTVDRMRCLLVADPRRGEAINQCCELKACRGPEWARRVGQAGGPGAVSAAHSGCPTRQSVPDALRGDGHDWPVRESACQRIAKSWRPAARFSILAATGQATSGTGCEPAGCLLGKLLPLFGECHICSIFGIGLCRRPQAARVALCYCIAPCVGMNHGLGFVKRAGNAAAVVRRSSSPELIAGRNAVALAV
jgi:hypothetical protein